MLLLQVKHWLTFNEPFVFVWLGYGEGTNAPGIRQPDTYPYLTAHNVIKAHAAAWHAYNNDFRHIQNGYCPFLITLVRLLYFCGLLQQISMSISYLTLQS